MKNKVLITIVSLFLFVGIIQDVSAQAFQVIVKTMDGRIMALDVDATDTIEILKQKLVDKTIMAPMFPDGIPIEKQRLVWNGQQLENGKTLHDYGIITEVTIHLVLRLAGG